jgi:hypothetical protein
VKGGRGEEGGGGREGDRVLSSKLPLPCHL